MAHTSFPPRTLTVRDYHIRQAKWSDDPGIRDQILYLDPQSIQQALARNPLVKSSTLDIIVPSDRTLPTHTVMDIIPIAAKAEGKIGEGITHWLRGVVVFLTGVDEDGKEVAALGSSHGILSEKVQFGTPGTPGQDDIILRFHAVIARGTGMERQGPIAAHQACDDFIQSIRHHLKRLPPSDAVRTKTFNDVRKHGKPRIIIVKHVSGQGAMQDKILLPAEPGGVRGGKAIVDLGDAPVMLRPLEIKDGGIHSLT